MTAMDAIARAMPRSISGEGTSAKSRSPKTAAAVGSPQAARMDAVPTSMRAMAVLYRMYGRKVATAAWNTRYAR